MSKRGGRIFGRALGETPKPFSFFLLVSPPLLPLSVLSLSLSRYFSLFHHQHRVSKLLIVFSTREGHFTGWNSGKFVKQCCRSLFALFTFFHSVSLPSLSLFSIPPTNQAHFLPGQLERVHDKRAGCPDLEGVQQPQPQAPGRPRARIHKRRRDLVPGDAQRRGNDVVDGQGPKGEGDRVGRVKPHSERDGRPQGAADGLPGKVEVDAARDGEDGGGEPGA